MIDEFLQRSIYGNTVLDYTKGIEQSIAGFETFLQGSLEWRGRVVYLLVVVPSRERVERYASLMNLIAKVYLASRNDERGVLILSEMAGAAHELLEALIVNPNDPDEMARAIRSALDIPHVFP